MFPFSSRPICSTEGSKSASDLFLLKISSSAFPALLKKGFPSFLFFMYSSEANSASDISETSGRKLPVVFSDISFNPLRQRFKISVNSDLFLGRSFLTFSSSAWIFFHSSVSLMLSESISSPILLKT